MKSGLSCPLRKQRESLIASTPRRCASWDSVHSSGAKTLENAAMATEWFTALIVMDVKHSSSALTFSFRYRVAFGSSHRVLVDCGNHLIRDPFCGGFNGSRWQPFPKRRDGLNPPDRVANNLAYSPKVIRNLGERNQLAAPSQ